MTSRFSEQAEIIQSPLIQNLSPICLLNHRRPSNASKNHSPSSLAARTVSGNFEIHPPERRTSVFSCSSTEQQPFDSPTYVKSQTNDCFEITQRSDSKLNQRVFVCVSCLIAFTGTDDAIETHNNSEEHRRTTMLKKLPQDPVSDRFRQFAERNVIVGGQYVFKLVCIHCKVLIPKTVTKLREHINKSVKHETNIRLSTNFLAAEYYASPKVHKADIAIKNTNGIMQVIDREERYGKALCTLCNESIVIVSWQRDVNVTGHEATFKHRELLELTKEFPEKTYADVRSLYSERQIERKAQDVCDYLNMIGEQYLQLRDDKRTFICTICGDILVPYRAIIDRHINGVRHNDLIPKLNGFNGLEFNYLTTRMIIGSKYK